MATVIKLKRGTTTPTTSDIVNGEVAINTSSKKLYINDSGTIKEVGGSNTADLDSLTDVTITDLKTGQILYYDGTEWKNDYRYNIGKRVPFVKENTTETFITLINSRDMTTVNGFLNHVVTQSYYLPFIKLNGTAVETLIPGN